MSSALSKPALQRTLSTPALKRPLLEEYVDVKGDEKSDNSTATLKNLLRQSAMSVGKSLKLPVVRTKIWNGGSAAGLSNTQFNTVVSLTPSTCAEFTQFANLYDECRVLGVTLHFSTLVAAASGSQPITMHGNVVYDPIDSTAYTSLLTSLAAAQKTGLIAVGTNQFGAFGAASSWATAPACMSKTGLFSKRFQAPKGPHAAVNGTPSGASTFYTEGLWYAVSNLTSGTDIYGYIKPYFEALASSTFQWEYWLEYDMAFRSRT